MSVTMVKELIEGLNFELSSKKAEWNKKYINTRIEMTISSSMNDYANWVIKTVAEKYGFTADQLKSKSRDRMLVLARYISMYIIDENTKFGTYTAAFLNRDRTTFYNMQESLEGLLVFYNHHRRLEQLQEECDIKKFNVVNNI